MKFFASQILNLYPSIPLICKKFHFQFFTQLQDSVSLRVFKLWQWSNNEKVSIFIWEFDFHNFIVARTIARAARYVICPKNVIFSYFSEYMRLRAGWPRAQRIKKNRYKLSLAHKIQMETWKNIGKHRKTMEHIGKH